MFSNPVDGFDKILELRIQNQKEKENNQQEATVARKK